MKSRRPSTLLLLCLGAALIPGSVWPQGLRAAPNQVVAPGSVKLNDPIAARGADDWIVYSDASYTPVVDLLSEQLSSARHALEAGNRTATVTALHAASAELRLQSEKVAKARGAGVPAAATGSRHMSAAALRLDVVAGAVGEGRIRTLVQLDQAISKATRADMDHRWMVVNVSDWYPASAQPQQHLAAAAAAYAKKDYQAGTSEVRMATGYLRLEAGRADGEARKELDRSINELDALAAATAASPRKDDHLMAEAFARANRSLAVEERSKSAEFWGRKEYNEAGYELRAAATSLENGAAWIGEDATADARAAIAATRALGDQLVAHAHVTAEAVSKGLGSLDQGIVDLGRKISVTGGSTRRRLIV